MLIPMVVESTSKGERSYDIHLYINSPGGSCSAGLAIYDTMNFIKCDVSTICAGTACSMGAFLLSSGAPGKRFALPNAEIMVHQVSSGTRGHVVDQRIQLEQSIKVNEKLAKIAADNCGLTAEEYLKLVDRDVWLTGEEATKIGTKGLIDRVVTKRE
jgi:ATP-dependent Clp protease protease subunit